MVVRLSPIQIPEYWDAIKFAATHADRVRKRDRELYLSRLLHALLSGTAQCFFRISDERKLLAVEITRITEDEVTGEKSLFLNCLYTFQSVPEDTWKSDMEYIKRFASEQGCKFITTYSFPY